MHGAPNRASLNETPLPRNFETVACPRQARAHLIRHEPEIVTRQSCFPEFVSSGRVGLVEIAKCRTIAFLDVVHDNFYGMLR